MLFWGAPDSDVSMSMSMSKKDWQTGYPGHTTS